MMLARLFDDTIRAWVIKPGGHAPTRGTCYLPASTDPRDMYIAVHASL